MEAITKANYQPGEQIFLALDVAASELYNQEKARYYLSSENKEFTSQQLIQYYFNLVNQYPIISIEDGLDQNDWENWTILNKTIGKTTQVVGDDLTVTNSKLLKEAIDCKCINSILIKLNQIGTFTETIETIKLAQNNNLGVIISHRSGETEDTTIADLAVATRAGQIKTGSLCRTDRVAKYNQLLRIEEYIKTKLLSKPTYANKKTLGCQEEDTKH
mgnify:CR=1 FL=1